MFIILSTSCPAFHHANLSIYFNYVQPIEAGTFARASEDVLKQRKIIRARRGPTSDAPPAAASNPFANVQLAPGAGSAAPAAAPAANPFAGVSLVAPAAAPAPAAAVTEAPAEEEKKAEAAAAPVAAEDPAPKPAAAPAPVVGGFGSFGAAAAAAPSGGLAFGSSGGFGSVKTGTGGFGFLAASNAASAPGTSAFGASTAPAFGAAATTAATTTETTTAPAAAAAPASVFGSATASGTPAFGAPSTKPSLPELPADVPVTTGEESESTVFSGTAVLFAFNPVKKEWTNRGSGGLKLNVNESTGQARMVMRQKDTLRLLLNANLWQGLNLTAQEGQSAMSFTCFNHVDGPPATEGAAAEKESGSDGNGDKAVASTLETYAVKLKKAEIPEFIETVKRHMPKGGEAV